MGVTGFHENCWRPVHIVLGVTAVLAVAVYPLFLWRGLHPAMDWRALVLPYWAGCGFRSLFVAALLYAVVERPFANICLRYRQQRARLLILLPLTGILWITSSDFSIWLAAIVISIAVFEVVDRANSNRFDFGAAAGAILPAALLLFITIILVFSYIDLIVVSRGYANADVFYNRLDRILLGGLTVPTLVHSVVAIAPLRAFRILEFLYFSLYGFIGAGIICVGLKYGGSRALQMVATISAAYYMSLLLYWLAPSVGPFYLCSQHAQSFPSELATYRAHLASLAYLKTASTTHQLTSIGVDYFIAFPSMHIAQPVIVTIFLRRWRGAMPWMLAYTGLVTVAILLLEWHYAVDLVGGVLVALLAFKLVGRTCNEHSGAALLDLDKTINSESTISVV